MMIKINKPRPPYFLVCSFCMLMIVGLFSCGDSTDNKNEFDRSEFLDYYGNTMLVPRMNDLSRQCSVLLAAVENLSDSPTIDKLLNTREAHQEAMLSWQHSNFLNFGPGDKNGLRLTLLEELALWPVNESVIELKIESGDYSLDDSWRNSRGLMSIEYLLYQGGDEVSTLELLTSDQIAYLLEITKKLNEQATDFDNRWDANYIKSFIENNGTDVTSSTTLLYNEWLRSYELLKNMKIVEPLGLKAGQSGPEPDLVESPYAGKSLDYAKAHFTNVVEIYSGNNNFGFDDYLMSVDGGDDLVSRTYAQITIVNNAFDEVPTEVTMKELAEQEDVRLITLQNEMQILLPMFKSEMSSLLGLAITYSSSDGD